MRRLGCSRHGGLEVAWVHTVTADRSALRTRNPRKTETRIHCTSMTCGLRPDPPPPARLLRAISEAPFRQSSGFGPAFRRPRRMTGDREEKGNIPTRPGFARTPERGHSTANRRPAPDAPLVRPEPPFPFASRSSPSGSPSAPDPARTIRCPDDRSPHRARADRLDAATGGSPVGGTRSASIGRTHSGREVGPIRSQTLGPADPRLAPRRTRPTPPRRSTPVRSHPRRTRPCPTAAIPRRHTSHPGLTPTHSRSMMPARAFLRVSFSST